MLENDVLHSVQKPRHPAGGDSGSQLERPLAPEERALAVVTR
ncbi:MAG: hypothetical protein ABSA59_04780 [Terriglobia bacterium]|jgi:hypothetical protein